MKTKKQPITVKKTFDNLKTPVFIFAGMVAASAINKAVNKGAQMAGLGQTGQNAADIATPLLMLGAGLVAPQLLDKRSEFGKIATPMAYGVSLYGVALSAKNFFNTDILNGVNKGSLKGLGYTPNMYKGKNEMKGLGYIPEYYKPLNTGRPEKEIREPEEKNFIPS